MPYKTERDNSLVTVIFSGVISDDDVIKAVGEVREIAAQFPELDELADFSGAESIDVTAEAVQHVAENPAIFSARSRQAFVASEDMAFGMARMFGMLAQRERPNLRVFRTVAEAMRWLGRDVEV